MIYKQRIYACLPALHQRFENVTLKLWRNQFLASTPYPSMK